MDKITILQADIKFHKEEIFKLEQRIYNLSITNKMLANDIIDKTHENGELRRIMENLASDTAYLRDKSSADEAGKNHFIKENDYLKKIIKAMKIMYENEEEE